MKTLNIADAKIVKRNFSGKPDQFNPAGGVRKFLVLIPPSIDAEQLKEEGWNVKWFKPTDPDMEPDPFLEVKVAFENVPPKVYMITSGNKTLLDEETIGQLDAAEIKKVDIIINPYHWTVRGQSGVKAYVRTMYVTIVEDEFEKNYRFDEQLPGNDN